jgi:hypothetical protein
MGISNGSAHFHEKERGKLNEDPTKKRLLSMLHEKEDNI